MIGELLDRRYRITQVLASGGFSQTYLAQDTRIPGEPLCVVKHLKPQTRDPQLLETIHRQFQREAEILARLGEYPQIPRLLAHFEENQEFYLVQEYIAGHPLTAELTPSVCWSESQVKAFLLDILVTLKFVHQNGVIHRDVKPANIIRRRSDNKLVLIDFGAVKEIATTTTSGDRPTVGIGTPVYMPLEQLKGYPQFSSDLFAVGVVAVQAASGLSINELQSAIDPDYPGNAVQWRDRAQVSPGLEAILTRLVQGNYRQRYQMPQEVIDALDAIEAQVVTAPATILDLPSSPAQSPSSTETRSPHSSGDQFNLGNTPITADQSDTRIDRPDPLTPPPQINRVAATTRLDAIEPSPVESTPPQTPLGQWLEQTKPKPKQPSTDAAAERRSASAQTGRNYVIAIAVIYVFVRVGGALVSNLPQRPTQVLLDGLVVALFYFLWQGFGWARWVAGVMIGFTSLMFLLGALGLAANDQIPLSAWALLSGVLYLGAAIVLLIFADVKAFQAAQRAKRRSS